MTHYEKIDHLQKIFEISAFGIDRRRTSWKCNYPRTMLQICSYSLSYGLKFVSVLDIAIFFEKRSFEVLQQLSMFLYTNPRHYALQLIMNLPGKGILGMAVYGPRATKRALFKLPKVGKCDDLQHS